MSKARAPGIPWQPGWNSGKTTLIRVPIALKEDVLIYARFVDSKLKSDHGQQIPFLPGDFLQQFTLLVIDRYIEFRQQHHHPNQHSSKPKISSRPWDELRRFQKLIADSPELLS